MRIKFYGRAESSAGNAIASATVKIYLAGTSTPAIAYSSVSSAVQISQVTTDEYGYYTFYIDAFDYDQSQRFDLVVTKLGSSTEYTFYNIQSDNIIPGTYNITQSTLVAGHVTIPNGVTLNISNGVSLVFSVMPEIGFYQVFTGAGTVEFPAGCRVYTDWWGDDLGAAVDNIGVLAVTLVISDTISVTEDISVPSNICLLFEPPGKLDIETGYTVTISNMYVSGKYQIFDGLGSVSFITSIVNEVYPEWWGAVIDSDSITSLQSAVDTGLPVMLSGMYNASDTLNFNNDKSQAVLLGKNWRSEATSPGSGITFTDGSKPGIKIDFASSGVPQAIIRGILLKGAAGTTNGHNAIYMPGGTGKSIGKLKIENVMLDDWGDDGIHLSGQTGPVFIHDVWIYDCNGYGIYITDDGDTNRPSEVIIQGGVIQGTCLGGIAYDCSIVTAGAIKIIGTDIELDSNTKPLIYLKNLYGSTVINPTLSTSATSVTDDAVVVIDGSTNGVSLIDMYCIASGGINNVHFKSGNNNRIIGGFFSNKASGYPTGLGYFVELTSNDYHQIIGPSLAATYDTGRDIVHGGAGANFSIIKDGFIRTGQGGLGVGNSEVGDITGGTPTRLFKVYDMNGNSIGYVQTYVA